MVNFVAFHAEFPDGRQLAPPHPKRRLERIAPHHGRMLEMLGRSAKLTQPASRLTLLANEHFQLHRNSPFEVVRVPVSTASVMLDRTRAQKAYIDAYDFAEPLIFIDTDMLLNQDLGPLFEQDFDIGLTWRPLAAEPINGGLILVNNRRPAEARAFFDEFLALYEQSFSEQATWFGDQAALCRLLDVPAHGTELPRPQRLGAARIQFFPCDTFNFTPLNHAAALASPLDDKAVLHFKGPRKWMMHLYWQAYLAPREATRGAQESGRAARELIAAMVQSETAPSRDGD